jgi:ketosteroid isomerase-like protein
MRTAFVAFAVVLCAAASSRAQTKSAPAAAQTRPAAKAAAHGDHDMEKMLAAFADAWNRHDVDALMSFMTPDGVFEASAGNTVNGERHEGAAAVRAAYAAVFATYPDARWNNARHFVAGDRGFSEWTFTGTMKDGKRVEVTGCDLFTFKNGKIAVKNSYRKNRPPIG